MEGYFFRQDTTRATGNFEGYGFLGVDKSFIFNFDPIEFKDPAVRKTKLNAEVANGSLAMVAIMPMLDQKGTVGTTGPEMWLPSAPSRASFVCKRRSASGIPWACPRMVTSTPSSAAARQS